MTGIRTGPAPAARIVVDWTRCDGHGLCAELSDGAISLDDWGYPILPFHGTEQNKPANKKETQMDERIMRRIIAFCPALALRLEHGGSAR